MSKKTNVLYVVESFSTGVYAIVRDIACNLDPDRFNVLIIHSLRDDSPSTIEKDFDKEHIRLLYIPMSSGKEYLTSIKKIRIAAKAFNPDSIHLHSSKAGFLGRLALKSFKVPVIYSPHGFSFLRVDVGPLKRWIFFQLEYWINKYKPSTVVAVSEGEKQHALRFTKNVQLINNFIDTKGFESSVNEEVGLIATCGRISPQKNPVLFNEIALALPHLSFLWIGDGPLKETLTSPNISVTGLLTHAEAIEHVKRCSVYLQTSLWEGMPVSILEAMAASKACVASDVVGNRDLIQTEKTGYLCDPKDPESFVQKISLLMEDDEQRKKIGERAKNYIVEYHELGQAVRAYEDLYLATV